MSFGFSIGDIIALLQVTRKAHEAWKGAFGTYSDLTVELDSLVILMKQMKAEAEKPNSIIFRQSEEGRELFNLIKNTTTTVDELRELVVRYKGLGKGRKRNWDRLRLGSKDLGPLRSKLTIHISAITAYLETIGIGSLGRVEHSFAEMKTVIDNIAMEIRAGRREESIMTTYENDDKHVWRQFRKELIGEGFSSDDIRHFSSSLKAHLKSLRRQGLLDEEEPVQPDNTSPASDNSVPESINKSINPGGEANGPPKPTVECESESNNEDVPLEQEIPRKEPAAAESSVEDWIPYHEGVYQELLSVFKKYPERYCPDISKAVIAEIKRSFAVINLRVRQRSKMELSTPVGLSDATAARRERAFTAVQIAMLFNELIGLGTVIDSWYLRGHLSRKSTVEIGNFLFQYPRDLSRLLSEFANCTDSSVLEPRRSIGRRLQHITILGWKIRRAFESASSDNTTAQTANGQGISTTSPATPPEQTISSLLIEFPIPDIPYKELFPIRGIPFLPYGWYYLISEENRVFYVDAYAERGFKKCFWNPPVPERDPSLRDTAGWTRIENAFGRVYWRNDESGKISYDHPHHSLSLCPHDESYSVGKVYRRTV
ncbi:hypothetical protein F5884DRAFT_805703 [Xylogone sp. PMI_703]|nr:hypothetical protein F5884DRAFT_805703 [Xylogone sp. PMI_703]